MPEAANIEHQDERLISSRHLWAAVLKQAVHDAEKPDQTPSYDHKDAVAFFTDFLYDEDLRIVCGMAGVNYRAVRSTMRRRLLEGGLL